MKMKVAMGGYEVSHLLSLGRMRAEKRAKEEDCLLRHEQSKSESESE